MLSSIISMMRGHACPWFQLSSAETERSQLSWEQISHMCSRRKLKKASALSKWPEEKKKTVARAISFHFTSAALI